MVTFYVTYSGDEKSWFDRDYWLHRHLPMVRQAWKDYGLIGTDGFFPSGDGCGFIAICPCLFQDEADIHAALAAPETKPVMDDVANFTSVQPEHHVARRL
jgi:uncharacterized protein (TIGR02118 family)